MTEYVGKGQYDKADQLLSTHGVDYYSSHSTRGKGAVSTQNEISEDESSFHIYVRKNSGDIYTVDGYANLSGVEDNWKFNSRADDACGIVIDGDEWSAMDPDIDKVTAEVSHYAGSSSAAPNVIGEDFDPNQGVATSVDFPSEMSSGVDTTIHLSTEFRDKTDSGVSATPIKFKYSHHAAYSDTISAVSVSIGPAGLQIDLSSASEAWAVPVTAGPGESDHK